MSLETDRGRTADRRRLAQAAASRVRAAAAFGQEITLSPEECDALDWAIRGLIRRANR